MTRKRSIIWLAAVASLLLAGEAFAETIVVNSTGTGGDLSGDTVCGNAAGECTFEAAIGFADSDPDFDVIDLTQVSGVLPAGSNMQLGSPVAIRGDGDIIDASAVAVPVTLNGDGSVISGVTFTNLNMPITLAGAGCSIDSVTAGPFPGITVIGAGSSITNSRLFGLGSGFGAVTLRNSAIGSLVEGNVIGIDPAGNIAAGRAISGIFSIAADAVISTNTIAGFAHGLIVNRAPNNTLYKNQIGDVGTSIGRGATQYGIFLIGANGATLDSNVTNGNGGAGVVTLTGSGYEVINHVAHNNGGPGIWSDDSFTNVTGSSLEGNSEGIKADFAGGIYSQNRITDFANVAIDIGADGHTPNDDPATDGVTNSPSLAAATGGSAISIDGSLQDLAGTGYTIEFFETTSCDEASGIGDADAFLGSINVTTDTSGEAAFSATFARPVPADHFVTATATGRNGTSELGDCLRVMPGANPTIDVEFYKLNSWTLNPRSWKPLIGLFLGSETSDVTDIALSTVRLGTAAPSVAIYVDVNRDGHKDLVIGFIGRFTGAACGDTEVELTGESKSGAEFSETLGVRIVGCQGNANGHNK